MKFHTQIYKIAMKPSYIDFEVEKYKWKPNINYRENPDLYKIGKGQQGVLICQPYKSEISPFWKFRTEKIAKQSANMIYGMFLDYIDCKDFVGADIAKKYLHMGYTRSRRYANHRSGKKWIKTETWNILPQEIDWNTNEKAKSANIFYVFWKLAREDKEYLEMKRRFQNKM